MLCVRKYGLIMVIALVLGFFLASFIKILDSTPHPVPSPKILSPETVPTPAQPLPRVLLDPGHGGWDGGTHDHHGLKEKDLVLRFAFLLEAELKNLGFPVFMTRTTDRELSEFAPYQGTRQRTDLCARARMMKTYEADLFISLHVNAAANANFCGAITFYPRKSIESKRLAQSIQNAIQRVQPYNRQTILPGNFYLLNVSAIPAALLEIGFITHPREHVLLQNSLFLQNMAREVANGIYQYVTESKHASSHD